MPPDPPQDIELDRFAEAVVQEIWNEMGRQRITSLRELARRAGLTHTSVIVRMNGDNRTGKRVPINSRDLYALGFALATDPHLFIARAQDAMNAGRVSDLPSFTTESVNPDELSKRRDKRSDFQQLEDEAARDEDKPKDED